MPHFPPSAAIINAKKVVPRPKFESFPMSTFEYEATPIVGSDSSFGAPLVASPKSLFASSPFSPASKAEIKPKVKVIEFGSPAGCTDSEMPSYASFDSIEGEIIMTPTSKVSVESLASYFRQGLHRPPSYESYMESSQASGTKGHRVSGENGDVTISENPAVEEDQVEDIGEYEVPAAPPCSDAASVVAEVQDALKDFDNRLFSRLARDDWESNVNRVARIMYLPNTSVESVHSIPSTPSIVSTSSDDLNPFEGDSTLPSGNSPSNSVDSSRWVAFTSGLAFLPKAPIRKVKSHFRGLDLFMAEEDFDA